MTVCLTARHEALGFPGDTGDLDALAALPADELDALAAAAGHALVEVDGACGWRWEVLTDLCVLDAGHAGPHEFSPRDRIVLEFAP